MVCQLNENRKEPKMKRSKRCLKRQEKRHQDAIEKHELKVRIREIRKNIFEQLGLSLAGRVIA